MTTIYTFGPYELDTHVYQLRCAGKPIALQPRVYQVLAYLVQHHYRLVTKQELIERFWATEFVDRTVVARSIMALRQALRAGADTGVYIQTVRGHGYRFVGPVVEYMAVRAGRVAPVSAGLAPVELSTGTDGLISTPTSDLPRLFCDPTVQAGPVNDYLDTMLGPQRLSTQPPHPEPLMLQTRTLHPFVGREAELATLRLVLRQAEAERGQVLAIIGESGMGKARLLQVFQQEVTARSYTSLHVRCRSDGSMTPYGVLRTLVRQLCGLSEADAPAVCTTKVAQSLQERGIDADVWSPYVLDLLGVSGALRPAVDSPPAAHQAQIFEVLHQLFLQSSRQRPLVLHIEGLQWIDVASEVYLTALVERLGGAALLILLTYRPGYQPPWRVTSYITRLALQPLSSDASRQLLWSVCGERRLEADVEQQILARAQGNPLFLGELTVAQLQPGADPTSRLFPDPIRATVAARLAPLPAGARRLLQTASVLGTEVPLVLLRTLVDLPDDVLSAYLRQLQVAELLYVTSLLPTPTYLFKCRLTQEVLYASLSQFTRQRLRARVEQARRQINESGHAARL